MLANPYFQPTARVGRSLSALMVLVLAGSQARVVSVSYVHGGAQVRRPAASAGWDRAVLHAPVREGERIRTDATGSLEILLECGSALRLTPNTVVAAAALGLNDDGTRTSGFALSAGTLYATVQKGDAGGFRVALPGGGIAVPDGPAALRFSAEASGPASVELLDGHGWLSMGAKRVRLEKTRRLRLGPGEKMTEVAPAPHDTWWQWSHVRDDMFHRAILAQSPGPMNYPRAPGFDLPFVPGLARYPPCAG